MPESPKFDLNSFLHAGTPRELKLAGDASAAGEVEGIASYFSGVPGGEADSYGDVIAKGAYARTLAEHKSEGTLPFMLWQHDTTDPIGRWIEMRETDQGLFVRGQLNLETESGKRAHSHLKAGDIRGLSIGFRLFPNGAAYDAAKGVRVLSAIDLLEVSLVTFPAARRAGVTAVKSLGSPRELEQVLREAGLPGRAAKKITHGGWPALSCDENDDQSPQLDNFAKRIDAARLSLKGFT